MPLVSKSRPWRITVKETLDRTIVAEDSVETKIVLPPVLPPSELSEILTRHLKERGFEDDGSKLSRERGGVRVEVDPDSGGVKVSASGSEDVSLEGEGDLPACSPCAERARASVKAGLQEALQKKASEQERELQRQVTGRLERALGELGCELERVGNQAAGTAVRRKAGRMGRIKTIEHDNESGAVTITVEV